MPGTRGHGWGRRPGLCSQEPAPRGTDRTQSGDKQRPPGRTQGHTAKRQQLARSVREELGDERVSRESRAADNGHGRGLAGLWQRSPGARFPVRGHGPLAPHGNASGTRTPAWRHARRPHAPAAAKSHHRQMTAVGKCVPAT